MLVAPWVCAVAATLSAGLVTLLLIPSVCRLARRLGGVAIPGGRHDHQGEIPCLGGLAIVTAASVAILGVSFLCSSARILEPLEALFLALATGVVFALGLLDDLHGITFAKKFAVQAIAAGTVIAQGFYFDVVHVPFLGPVHLGWFGIALTLVWIVGVTNAINLIDGLDGLAAGTASIIALSFMGLALVKGDTMTAVVAGAFGGASLFFLKANWTPARIFMGDSGSLTLGFVLAVLSVHSSFKSSAAVAVFVPLLALGLPAIDALAVMAARYVKSPRRHCLRRLVDMFQADRQHLHYLMSSLERRRNRIVLTLYLLVAAFCAMALVVALSGSVQLGLACFGIELVAIAAIRLLAERRRDRLDHALEVARSFGRDRPLAWPRIFLGHPSGPAGVELVRERPPEERAEAS